MNIDRGNKPMNSPFQIDSRYEHRSRYEGISGIRDMNINRGNKQMNIDRARSPFHPWGKMTIDRGNKPMNKWNSVSFRLHSGRVSLSGDSYY